MLLEFLEFCYLLTEGLKREMLVVEFKGLRKEEVKLS
jgi:hypothetical protein